MIHLDSFYTIGKTHKICEDYVIHGNDPISYVILGDGCSSSPDTDVGVRLLVQTVKAELKAGLGHLKPESMLKITNKEIKTICNALMIPYNSMDSSLVILKEHFDYDTNKKMIRLIMAGDGIVIGKMKHRLQPDYTIVSYEKEMPYYLSYALDKERNNEYDRIARRIDPNGHTKGINNGNGIVYVPYWDLTVIDYPIEDYQYIMVASDGLNSFYKQETGDKWPLDITIKSLGMFKSVTGEFLKRRIKRILKDYEKEGIYHYDDLSIGIIYNLEDR